MSTASARARSSCADSPSRPRWMSARTTYSLIPPAVARCASSSARSAAARVLRRAGRTGRGSEPGARRTRPGIPGRSDTRSSGRGARTRRGVPARAPPPNPALVPPRSPAPTLVEEVARKVGVTLCQCCLGSQCLGERREGGPPVLADVCQGEVEVDRSLDRVAARAGHETLPCRDDGTRRRDRPLRRGDGLLESVQRRGVACRVAQAHPPQTEETGPFDSARQPLLGLAQPALTLGAMAAQPRGRQLAVMPKSGNVPMTAIRQAAAEADHWAPEAATGQG